MHGQKGYQVRASLEHVVELGGSRGWVVCFRETPPTGRSLLRRLKDCFNGRYDWHRYLRFREDKHLVGYDMWSSEDMYFRTPKEARDFFLANLDGFAHNERIRQQVEDKCKGLI